MRSVTVARDLPLDPHGQVLFENVRRRDELAVVLGHLAVEPFDELRSRHDVEFDAVVLQPFPQSSSSRART